MTEHSTHRARTSAETTILGALWRWALPILLVTVLAAGGAWYAGRSEAPVRTVQSEILVRIGYEYSPVPWSSVSETQQINFRADEVIGTEIQLLTAEQTMQKALKAVPHPEIRPEAGKPFDEAQVLMVRQKLGIKRLEGSNVILLEVTDLDQSWSLGFSQALLDAYFEDRLQLFSNTAYDNMLAAEEAEAANALAALDEEALVIARRIADTSAYLSDAGAALAASPVQPELRASLAKDLLALRIYVLGSDQLSALQETLDQLAGILALQSTPVATAGTGTRVSGELIATAVDQLADGAARLNTITAERDHLSKRLDAVRTAQLRKTMRDGASNNMTVMTPPRVLATTNGIDRIQRTALAGLMALILSSLFFVYVDGTRRPSV